MLSPHSLTCDHLTNPIGLDERQPRLSWKLDADQHPATQSAYQIRVTTDNDELQWDSEKQHSNQSIHIPYTGSPLTPRQQYRWQVRVWDQNDEPSNWSEAATWETGLIDHANWQADWITPDWDEELSEPQPAPLLRHDFALANDIVRARLYVTSLGLYEVYLNGQRVGDGLLTPGWTTYKKRVQYQTYDVTDLLHAGDNAAGALLGDGWYRGHMGFQRERNLYGDRLALLFQLEVTYADGTTALVISNDSWKATTGPIRMADFYWGEHYNAQEEKSGWSEAGYADSDWNSVRKLEHPTEIVVAQRGPFVKRQEVIRPQRIFQSPKGETILDFGQNMVGWVRLRVAGPAGTTVTICHAEVLDQEGNFYTENLRFAKQEAKYTLKGEGEERYEPRFSFFGFQYITVEGFPGEPTLDHFEGVVIHSEMTQIGDFHCSNPLINQLQHNILWGQKGNFVDVPTDCPQRDERLGWTGDAQVFIRTACFNMDVAAFFTKWLADLRADQQPNGSVSFVVPDVITREDGGFSLFSGNGAAAWSDAVTICPWTLYLSYGDTEFLAENYDSMVAWVEWMRSKADDDLVWRQGFQFGDWLDYRGSFALKPSPVTNDELVGTAFFAFSAALTAQSARVLGKLEEAEQYQTLSDQVKASFCREFVTDNGRVGPNSQTAYVLALHFDLLPEEVRTAAAARLAEIVRQNDYHLTTGFVGTPYLCHVLSRFGHTDVAYELLNQESFPSWLYPVNKGATTIWERWDGIKPDGSFQDASMNSFNHYAYGAIGEWLYRVVAGIEVDESAPGYQHILFQPQPGGGLTHARAAVNSPYGPVESAWELSDEGMTLTVTVPVNASATVHLPAQSIDQLQLDGVALQQQDNIHHDASITRIEIGSGTYTFFTSGLTLPQTLESVRHVAGRLDRYLTLGSLMSNEQAKTILAEELGAEILSSPSIGMAMGQSLVLLAERAPGVVTEDKLDRIDQKLSQIRDA